MLYTLPLVSPAWNYGTIWRFPHCVDKYTCLYSQVLTSWRGATSLQFSCPALPEASCANALGIKLEELQPGAWYSSHPATNLSQKLVAPEHFKCDRPIRACPLSPRELGHLLWPWSLLKVWPSVSSRMYSTGDVKNVLLEMGKPSYNVSLYQFLILTFTRYNLIILYHMYKIYE